MTATDDRSAPPTSVFSPARLVLLAALIAGLFGMHGLMMPSMIDAADHRMASVTGMAATAVGSTPLTVHAAVSIASAELGMPVPSGGHAGHDLSHACLAVLTVFAGFAALALLAAALVRTVGLLSCLVARGGGLPTGPRRRRREPNCLSLTQLCISRT